MHPNNPSTPSNVQPEPRKPSFERFTDRARKVIALANQEAQRLNHEYIDPAHILIGLANEGAGVGAHALKNLGADLDGIRRAVEALQTPGPEMVTMGKLPQSLASKQALLAAIDTAIGLNHNYVGTEHVLLGLLSLGDDSVPGKVLGSMGITTEKVREEVLNLIGKFSGPPVTPTPSTPAFLISNAPPQIGLRDYIAIQVAAAIAGGIASRNENGIIANSPQSVAEIAYTHADCIIRLSKAVAP